MKLFQSLLVAPAVLGFLSPLTANSAELNLGEISRYSNNNVENNFNFSELYPSDWSYKALSDIVVSRNCSNLIPSGSISRFEAASIINSCLKDFSQVTEQERRLIDEFNSELALVRSRVDGLDSRLSEVEAGSFSSTTVASFSADFAIGAVSGKSVTVPGGTTTVTANADAGNLSGKKVVVQNADSTEKAEALSFDYSYEIDLTTSFTGDDSLEVTLAAGVGTLSELDLSKDDGSKLVVDGISYTFPLGEKVSAFFGIGVDGSTLFNTACVYGGPTDTLDDCGNNFSAINEGANTAAGASYDFGNGFIGAIGFTGDGTSKNGLFTEEGDDAYSAQISYTADNYGFSVTFAEKENPIMTQVVTDATIYGFNAYYDPTENSLPSISVGFETASSAIPALSTTKDTDSNSWFIGLQWDELANGTFGAAVGTKQHTVDSTNSGVQDEELMYEAFYSYDLNDSITITPIVYLQTQSEANTDDETGIMVKSSFSF